MLDMWRRVAGFILIATGVLYVTLVSEAAWKGGARGGGDSVPR